MVAGGTPRDVDDWTDLSDRCFSKTEALRRRLKFAKTVAHRRGDFNTVRRGISHGGGQTVHASFFTRLHFL